jgi:hypothetical protein
MGASAGSSSACSSAAAKAKAGGEKVEIRTGGHGAGSSLWRKAVRSSKQRIGIERE